MFWLNLLLEYLSENTSGWLQLKKNIYSSNSSTVVLLSSNTVLVWYKSAVITRKLKHESLCSREPTDIKEVVWKLYSAKNGTVVWDVTPYNLIVICQILGGKYSFTFGVRGKLRREEEIFCDVMSYTPNARAVFVVRNDGKFLPDIWRYILEHTSLHLLPWEAEI